MPKSNLVEMMRANAAARQSTSEDAAVASEDNISTPAAPESRVSLLPSGIPLPPHLPEMLRDPEGLASWDRDWERMALWVTYGLQLFDAFNAILDAHQREKRKPEAEAAKDPRARAQQIIEVLRKYQERYEGILAALTRWQQAMEGLRRFHLTSVPAAAWQGLRVAVSGVTRKMRQPQNALGAIPPLPAIPAADDEPALEAALALSRQVRALLSEHVNAPQACAQAIFAVRDRIARVAEIIREEDLRLSTDPANHSLTTVPSVYPVLDVRAAIPMGVVEQPDTSALGQHDPWFLPA